MRIEKSMESLATGKEAPLSPSARAGPCRRKEPKTSLVLTAEEFDLTAAAFRLLRTRSCQELVGSGSTIPDKSRNQQLERSAIARRNSEICVHLITVTSTSA